MTSESIVESLALVVDPRNHNVDVDVEDEDESDSEVTNDTNKPVKNERYSTCMQLFINRIYDALKKKEPWLRKLLDMNDWWVRASWIPFIMPELGWKDHDEIEYYMDIYVWEPETRFGETGTPPCPNCKSSKQVVRKGKDAASPCRRVCGLTRDYYIMGFRYKCNQCSELVNNINKSEKASDNNLVNKQPEIHTFFQPVPPPTANNNNNTDDDDDDDDDKENNDNIQNQNCDYHDEPAEEQASASSTVTGSFKAWNEFSLRQNPFSGYFPAMLTAKAGVDNDLVDMMVSAFDSGMKSEQFANMLKELHTSHKTKLEILRERKIQQGTLNKKGELFSTFNDPSKYNGRLHGGGFFSFVYKRFSAKCKAFLGKEMKKRGGTQLNWDASYKTCKVLSRIEGNSLYKALITATNEFGEIRIQFMTVSDGHDQMVVPLREFKRTQNLYGLPLPTHFSTDNVTNDRPFFLEMFPGARAKQTQYDNNQVSVSSANDAS